MLRVYQRTRQLLKKSSRSLLVLAVTFGFAQEATTGYAARACANGRISSTVYFVPSHNEGRYASCSSPSFVRAGSQSIKVCPRFRSEVRMQGSGLLQTPQGTYVLRYTGRVERQNCNGTVKGAAGRCLMPFFSIAADPRYHRLGDIVYVPEMAGRLVRLPPDNREISHPGYFRVDDVGGAIKGRNRFDFYTGTMGPRANNNFFGSRGPRGTQMATANQCNKTARTLAYNSGAWQSAIEKMAIAMGRGSGTLLAESQSGSRGGRR